MAKSMKIPVLIFEHFKEPEALIEGLRAILLKLHWKKPTKEAMIKSLIKELEQTVEIMKRTNTGWYYKLVRIKKG